MPVKPCFYRLTHGWKAFSTACSFLTRMGGGRLVDSSLLSDSVCWYPVVGLVLGLMCTALPFVAALCALGAAHGPWLWAWLYVVMGFWLTRGLHWDGLADLSDAWGSGASGDRFWSILRDSRMGAFGAMGLIMGFSGLLILVQAHMAQHSWWPLVWAPLVGRALCLVLAALTPPHDPQSLGGMACAGATSARAMLWAAFTVGLILWSGGWLAGGVFVLLGGMVVLALRFLACRHGGCNGDFLGAAIIGGEIVALAVLL